MSGIKRTPADKWFSDCVRARADWSCELCDKQYPDPSSRGGLHCSHHFGRRHKRLRWEPLNAASLCFACHNKVGEDPLFHVEWFEEHVGCDSYEILVELKQVLIRKKDYAESDISKHYRDEFRIIQGQRDAGVTGRIDFAGYF